MIRERQIQSTSFSAGAVQLVDLPRDAVFHLIQFSIMGGSWVSVQGAMGTGGTFESTFPFCLIRNIRLIRNGSDVVWQGSGAQLAKEHYYLNNAAPFARIYTVSSNVETLRTASTRGITVPANPEGINANGGGFTVPDAPASSATVNFDMQMELWLQMGPEDAFYGTLVDARTLATFQVEITWATTAQCLIPGTANTSDTVTATLNILSIDQDNVDYRSPFGTFKRSANQIANVPFGTSNYQVLLPRGNYFHGVIFQTRAYKSASTSIPAPENAVLGLIDNRINSNFSLRKFNFNQLQAKNTSDNGGRSQAWVTAQGQPQGWAFLYYPSAGDSKSELVATYVMDQFDFQLSTNAQSAAQNGATTNSTNPIIDLLYQEVIPGVSVGSSAPRGAQAGSSRMTSTKPYG